MIPQNKSRIRFFACVGFALGFSLCYLLHLYETGWFHGLHQRRTHALNPLFHFDQREEFVVPLSADQNHSHVEENTAVADLMARSVRILCLVLTTEKYHSKRAIHVKQTWGQRCTKLIFASDAYDEKLGAVPISEKTDYNSVWGKVKSVFKYAYAHHLNDFDWFLKCDDDSYVVMENLRHILAEYDPDEPLVLGRRFRMFTTQGYMSGGAGYVLSRKAVDKFVTEALRTPAFCRINNDEGAEDAEMGRCLNGAGVKVANSLDQEGRQRFFPFSPESHLTESYARNHWIWLYDYYPLQTGPDCCTDTAATFHYVTPQQMYFLDYFIYHVRPFGKSSSHDLKSSKARLIKNGYRKLAEPAKPLHAIKWPKPLSAKYDGTNVRI